MQHHVIGDWMLVLDPKETLKKATNREPWLKGGELKHQPLP